MKIPSKIYKILYLAVFLITLLLLFSNKAPKVSADATCSIGNAVVEGTQVPRAQIPEYKEFNLLITCNNIPEPGAFQVIINGITKPDTPITSSGGSLAEGFGPFPGMTGESPAGTIYDVTISYFVPGRGSLPVGCTDCRIRVADSGLPPPEPTESPPGPGELNCPQFRGYNPDPPVLNQDVQIQFTIPQSADINNYILTWQQPFSDHSGTVRLTDASEFGVWVASISSVREFTPWTLFQSIGGQNIVCATGNIFDADTEPTGGFGSGRNPCGEEGDVCRTAFGNIPTDITKFAQTVLSIALGLAGGIALILLVYGSVRVLTSSGNPQNVAAGRDVIIAAVAGLLFLIFSVLILRALGLVVGIPLT